MLKRSCLFLCLLALVFASCRSVPKDTRVYEFGLHKIFTDHMVFQRQKPIRISGTAVPGSLVRVEIGRKKAETNTFDNGEWEVILPAMMAGGPYRLVVQCSGQQIVLDDILVGEVWMCSGQSNMQMPLDGGRDFWRVKNYEEEVRNANWPKIRIFQSARVKSPKGPVEEIKGTGWQVCSPETVAKFSAAGYFFGRQLYQDLGIPIGLIDSSWGGTRIQPWISEDAYRDNQRVELEQIIDARKEKPTDNSKARQEFEKRNAIVNAWIRKFDNSNPAATQAAKDWKNNTYDDSQWGSAADLNRTFKEIVGVGWFRVIVHIPDEWAKKTLVLNLGRVDDIDQTYFNGTLVGSTGVSVPEYWNVNRRYTIPGKLVKAGRNVIAVRATDYYGEGGLIDMNKPATLALASAKPDEAVLPLQNWKGRVEFAADLAVLGPRPNIDQTPMAGANSQQFPSTLYNSMIAPFTKMNIRGVIWYQGCSNAGQIDYYNLHKILIQDWRNKWNDPELPFITTQLSGFHKHTPKARPAEDLWTTLPPPGDGGYPLTREIQAEMLNLPNTGLAVTVDIGDQFDIHPNNKQAVGYRLAKEAERIAYRSIATSRGPMFDHIAVEGNKIRVFFAQDVYHTADGLRTNDGKKPGAFSIAGEKGVFVWADAEIDPATNTVVVSSPSVPEPRRVRYGWASYRGDANLINKAGFPAIPFRSDKPQY
ncbi:MAG: hypothetical protein IJJ26_05890 [Victivallales bacterium]|nr:hypothetical protein [Victivallales bacterium]